MDYGFHPEAADELEAVIAYYDSKQAGKEVSSKKG